MYFQPPRTNNSTYCHTAIFSQIRLFLIHLSLFMYLFTYSYTFRQHKSHFTNCSHKGLSRYILLLFLSFTKEDENVANLACLATQVYFSQSSLSVFCFLCFFFFFRPGKMKMLHTLLATQVLSPPRTIFTGLFCHRFIRHIGPSYTLLPHRTISFTDTKDKICTPHLPQRTIFHTGLLHALRPHRTLQSAN